MKNKIFKTLALTIALGLSINNVDATQRGASDDWVSYAGNTSNSKTTNTKTAIDPTKINPLSIAGSYREPIIINEKIYIVNAKGLNNAASLDIIDFDGNTLKQVPLAGGIGFFSRITYGDNKIFVPLKNQIQAIDATTYESLWISKPETGFQMISSLTYYNGYLYSGVTKPKGASTVPSDGFFFAMSTKDEDTSSPNEEKDYTWTWQKEEGTGFYWANAAIVKNAVVFAGDGGQLVSHHLTQPRVYDEYDLASNQTSSESFKVRSSIYYDNVKGEVLVGTQNSEMIFSIKMNNEKFNRSTIITKKNNGQISGGIAATSSRVYVPSGGMSAKSFNILDRDLDNVYTTNKYGSQSYPLISNGYGKDKYIYFMDYSSGKVIITKDDGSATPEFKEYAHPDLKAYNSNGIIANSKGDLVVPNYGGKLLILKNSEASYEKTEIEALIKSLPTTVAYTDKALIESVQARYEEYMSASGVEVSNKTVLAQKIAEYQAIAQQKVNKVINDIKSIPTSFSDDTTIIKVLALEESYHTLYEADKKLITNYDKLEVALANVKDIMDNSKVVEIIKRIDQLPTLIELNSEKAINEILKIYDYLTSDAKTKVTNIDKLNDAKKLIESQRQVVDKINKDILDLPFNIGIKDEAKIKNIINSYNALSATNKKYVNGYTYVLDCQKEINNLINKRNSVIKTGNTTNYYKKYAGVWFNYKRVTITKNVTNTYTYSFNKTKVKKTDPTPNNGSQLSSRNIETKKGKKVVKKQAYRYNKWLKVTSNNIYTLNKKNKFINTYRNTRSYYSNKRVKQNVVIKRNTNTNKVTYKQIVKYRSNGKKHSITTHTLKKNKLIKRTKKY